MITHDEMKKLALLARVELSDAEIEAFSKDFESILGYVEQINQAVIPEGSASHLQINIMRVDANAHVAGDHVDEMLSDAPDSESGFYKVPKIL